MLSAERTLKSCKARARSSFQPEISSLSTEKAKILETIWRSDFSSMALRIFSTALCYARCIMSDRRKTPLSIISPLETFDCSNEHRIVRATPSCLVGSVPNDNTDFFALLSNADEVVFILHCVLLSRKVIVNTSYRQSNRYVIVLTRTMDRMLDIDDNTPFASSTGTSSLVKSMVPITPSNTEMTLSREIFGRVKDVDRVMARRWGRNG